MATDMKKNQTDQNIKSGTKARGEKPIILSVQRYQKIVTNATTSDQKKAKAEAEEDQLNKEQLKKGNNELVAQFKGNMQRTQEQKLQQIQDQLDKKTKQALIDYEHAKENEAQKRREKIFKAQQIMERLKPGPRELHSAVLQSEVLRARNVQRSINEEFAKAVKKQELENERICNENCSDWVTEEGKRMTEKQKSTIAYKKELLQTINENQKQRSEQRKQLLKEQQSARQATDLDVKAQIEKERAIMEKKRDTLRKNALEAMKMVEQRRLRDRMVDEVEDRICCVYNTGRKQLNALCAEQTKKLADDRQNRIEIEAKKLNDNKERAIAMENESVRRDITTKQLQFTAEEQEKVRKDKAAKQARIEAYLKEMKQQKEIKRKIEEEKRFDMAQRFKNQEVNTMFMEAQREERSRQIQEVRTQLNQQIEERNRLQLAQKAAQRHCGDDVAEKEHKFFFEYARTLMEDAQQKGRPLYPFVQVVRQYKRNNQIDCDRKVPKHLQSSVPIGDKSTCPKPNAAQKQQSEPKNKTRDSILENCLKIEEIIKADNEVQKSKIAATAAAAASEAASAIPKEVCNSQLRYSMEELKKMNQFVAPTCH